MKVEIVIQAKHIDNNVSVARVSPDKHPLALAIREYFAEDISLVKVRRQDSRVIFLDGRDIVIGHSSELKAMLKWAEERGRMSACTMVVDLPSRVKFCLAE